MKVADVMSRQVDYVTTSTPVLEITRLIFGRGINGVPVVKGKKVVGFITERDILTKFYPSVEEYIEDPVHAGNFEEMEEKIDEIFNLTAGDLMSKGPTIITEDAPLLRAQSLMFVHKVGRLPVVDKNGNLVGIVSKGDIFRSLVGDKIPLVEDEEYHDWLSKHYDLVVDWGQRLGHEVPDLTELFKKEKVVNVLDIGCGTGEHDIALAKQGFKVLGLEKSVLMFSSAMKKREKLSREVAQKVNFANGDYAEVLKKQPKKFDAAIFMGNAFSHLVNDYASVLEAVIRSLDSNKSVLVFQIINFEKVFKVKKRFLDFNFAKSKLGESYEHGFLEFYDPAKKDGGNLTLTMAIIDFHGKKWKCRSINSAPIAPINTDIITKLLKKHGFKRINYYGSIFWGSLFKEEFKPLESDWLNVVAIR